jgi:hypothetical protein
MKVKRKFIIIGILHFVEAFICGLFPLISLIVVLLLPWYFGQQNDTVFTAGLSIVGVPTGTLSIIGGIYSLKRRKFGLVLTSSIAILLPCFLLLYFFIAEISDAITTINYSSIDIWYVIRDLDFWFVIPIAVAVTNLLLVIKAKKYFEVNNINSNPIPEPSNDLANRVNGGKKIRSKKLILVPIAALFVLLTILVVYSLNRDQPPYKLITFNKGVNFSFEYPEVVPKIWTGC